jgi:hypothetical protein
MTPQAASPSSAADAAMCAFMLSRYLPVTGGVALIVDIGSFNTQNGRWPGTIAPCSVCERPGGIP